MIIIAESDFPDDSAFVYPFKKAMFTGAAQAAADEVVLG